MNKDIIVDIRDISDSKELLSEKPNRSMVWFIYILIALIAAVVIWSCIGEIDQYVKAQGELRPNDKVSTIKNTITGRVLESNLIEGKHVKKGDLLFSMDVAMQTDTEAVLQRQYDNISKEIRNIEKYRDSIVQDTNLFDMRTCLVSI